MATEVVMPQMGESIAEGTIVRWLKKVGDKVDRDEPLFEISTDKVDAEIPSPAAGVLTEVRAHEGDTVPVNSVVALIGQASESAAAAPPAEKGSPAAPSGTTVRGAAPPPPAASVAPSAAPPGTGTPPAPASGVTPTRPAAASSTDERIRQRSSPLVRRIAKEHNIDISQMSGSGIAGRVTKSDILDAVGGGAATPAPRQGQAASSPVPATPAARAATPVSSDGTPGDVRPMSVMRKKIAEHMILSRRTSAHVHSVFEVNFSRVALVREASKAEYQRAGAKLTYMSFIVKAVTEALRKVPVINASIDGDNVVFHRDVNVGIAVALDRGLIVPVIKKADEHNLLGISRAIVDLAERARNKQLKPEEVTGGTFTITNPGVFGALFGMPIINQPQVAILGVGNIEKRPVVVDDAIGIRPMAYLTIGYDHRLIDGAVADEFMSQVKHTLENWDASAN